MANPVGVAGSWTQVFEDTFDGNALDTSKWVSLNYSMNNVNGNTANVAVSGGLLTLTLSDSANGAYITSNQYGARGQGYLFDVGHALEFRVRFPGNGTSLYNWPAVWSSGTPYPQTGETDIGEVLGAQLCANTHEADAQGNNVQGGPYTYPGYQGDKFVVLTAVRRPGATDFYLDGSLKKTIVTHDNGGGQSVLLNIGKNGNSLDTYGASGAMQVDYVRAWFSSTRSVSTAPVTVSAPTATRSASSATVTVAMPTGTRSTSTAQVTVAAASATRRTSQATVKVSNTRTQSTASVTVASQTVGPAGLYRYINGQVVRPYLYRYINGQVVNMSGDPGTVTPSNGYGNSYGTSYGT